MFLQRVQLRLINDLDNLLFLLDLSLSDHQSILVNFEDFKVAKPVLEKCLDSIALTNKLSYSIIGYHLYLFKLAKMIKFKKLKKLLDLLDVNLLLFF